MNSIFLTSFVLIMFFAFLKDLPRLKAGKASQKILYGLISLSSLVLLISRQFHMDIPMPAHFFIQTISPWVNRMIGT
jgi:hypothetical protein